MGSPRAQPPRRAWLRADAKTRLQLASRAVTGTRRQRRLRRSRRRRSLAPDSTPLSKHLRLERFIARKRARVLRLLPSRRGWLLRRNTRDVARLPQRVINAYDLDDNLLYMPTKIFLRVKGSDATVAVSTAAFADIYPRLLGTRSDKIRSTAASDSQHIAAILRRHSIALPRTADGTPLVLQVQGDGVGKPLHQSFRNFLDHDPTVYQKDVKVARDRRAFGPFWRNFVSAQRKDALARSTVFITQRGHAPKTIRRAFGRLLLRAGLIAHLPPQENVFPVKHAGLRVNGARVKGRDDSEAKVSVMKELLDELQRHRIRPGALPLLDASGKSRRKLNLFNFSDDSWGNIAAAVSGLSSKLARWPDVKVTLHYTGPDRSKPKTLVLMGKDRHRLQTPAERREVERVVRRW